jgi:hypothetical protein
LPYINHIARRALVEGFPVNAGELNYAITLLCRNYWQRTGKSANYQTINDIIGALEGAKLEFYRRVAVPYENSKMLQNGDVY